MARTIAGNRAPPRQTAAASWRRFEAQLRPEQPRFADFSRYGYDIRQVPAAIEEDLHQYFDDIDASVAAGARGLPSVQTVSDSEFQKLPLKSASQLEEAPDECAICCTEVAPETRLKVLPCGHCFHSPCLRRWFQRSRCCPCCRAPLLRSSRQSTAAQAARAGDDRTAAAATTMAYRRPRPPPRPANYSNRRGSGGTSALPAATAASFSTAPHARTVDGGVVVRHYEQPPAGMWRPPQVPPDAELLIVRYPEGTARVWRAPSVEQTAAAGRPWRGEGPARAGPRRPTRPAAG